ncbi:AsmA-like C-terminal region-containing protein [Bacteroidota bacterium]
MRFGNSRLGGDYSVYNLISPDFNYQIKTDLDLEDIQVLMKNDSIVENMQGRILAELQIKGGQALLSDLSKTDFLKYDYLANIRLDNVSLKFRKIPFHFNEFSGEVIFTDHLNIKNLNGIMEENQLSISGRIDNFLEFLLTPKGNLWMDVDLYSEKMDLNHLRTVNSGDDDEVGDSIFLPERLYLKSRFWLDELSIKDFEARQVTGELIYKPRRLSINNLELMSMQGRVFSEGILEQQNDMHFLVNSMSRISSLNITEVFSSFNNFGQEFIVDNHLKGTLSGMVNFSSGFNENLSIKKETILADCDVIIKDGELSGFEPMMKLSRFIEVEELENVRFSTLTNEIYIRNEEVVIPKMDINSSAFDITASGIHGFDMNFTYRAKVSLSELLSNKHRKTRESNSEFGLIQDDGLGRAYAYLIIEGNKEGTDIRYDRKGAVQNIRDQLEEEKQELKEIFNEEFGLFKKDPGIMGDSAVNDAPAFIIEWEEVRDSLPGGNMKPDNISDKERFIIEWDDEEEQEEPDFENKKIKRKKKN